MRSLRPGSRHSRERYNNYLRRRARRRSYERRRMLSYAFSELPRTVVFQTALAPGWIKGYLRRTP